MTQDQSWLTRGLEVSARAGVLLGAVAIGHSYQPNLLTRGTRDQALITGVAAASALGWGTTTNSFLRSVADRLPGSTTPTGRIATGVAVDGVVAVAGAVLARSRPWAEHEPPRRAVLRLAAGSTAAAAAAGVAAHALEVTRGRTWGRPVSLLAALAAGAGSYALSRPRRARAGSFMGDGVAAREDVTREVSPPQAIAMGAGTTLVLLAVARGESALSTVFARGAAAALGGEADDHRTIGRLGAFGTLAGIGWLGITAATAVLAKAGEGAEEAHQEAPDIPEITGSPASDIPWADQSREGRRWLSMTLRPDVIEAVLGEQAAQPIRVYASMAAASSEEERARLLLREIDRTGALDRSYFALFSPTGSGYVNYVASETFEYLTRGDCASACIEYSVLPSSLSLTRVSAGTHQTRMVMNGIVERLMARPADRRPTFVLFGESLGCQVSQEMFRGQGSTGPAGVGLDAAVWVGTPAATEWRKELWGDRSVGDAPQVGPDGIYLPRAVPDWHELPAEELDRVRFLLLQNGDDPIPKFGAPLLWRRPDWLGPHDRRPFGAPQGTRWWPVTTFFATFVDLQNALVPTPGEFVEGGHDYRVEIPEAVRRTFRLEATDDQMVRVQDALRRRELGWEVKRRWAAAEAMPTPKRVEAERALAADVSRWTGRDVDLDGIRRIIEEDTLHD